MDLISFLSLSAKLKEKELAGNLAHSLMAPPYRMKQLMSIPTSQSKHKKAAVLLLFFPSAQGELHFVLTRRRVYKGIHSGQICFPGGKPDPFDNDLWSTALRETHEEVGIQSDQINYLRSMTRITVPHSNFLIVPYVGYIDKPSVFTPDPKEVEAILEISFREFIYKMPIMTKQYTYSKASVDVPTYVFDQNEVWGVTAMILSEFKMLFSSVLPK